jgi:hypothetical protein
MAKTTYGWSLSIVLLLLPYNLGFNWNLNKPKIYLQNFRQISQNLLDQISTIPAPPPGREGRPRGNTGSGGTRGKCPQDISAKPYLTLLTPAGTQGLTVATNPTFFVFVPLTKARKGEFVLYDLTEKKLVYQTTFDLKGFPGIVSIKLPQNREHLKLNNSYEWRFLLHCKPNYDRSEDVMEIGFIKRVGLNEAIANLPANTSPLEKARVYQKHNLWYDVLQILAEQQPTTNRNSNIAAMWQEVLQSEKSLQEIVSYPLIECCKVGN